MRGPWEVGGSDRLSAYSGAYSQDPPPAPRGPPTGMGWAGYLDAVAGSKEVVEEESVAVDRQQRQQPRRAQQQ